MRKILGFTVILILIAAIWYFVWIKKQSEKINISVEQIRLAKPFSLQNLRTAEYNITIRLSNFSNANFHIEQIYTEYYNEKLELLARQTHPIAPFGVEKAQVTDLTLKFEAPTAKILGVLQDAGALPSLNYLIGNQDLLGQKVLMKGFVTVKQFGISISKEFDEWINV